MTSQSLTSPLPSLKSDDSCMVRPKAWSIYTLPVLRMGTSKGLVSLCFMTDSYLTFNSRTSSYRTIPLLVPASQTSVPLPLSPTPPRGPQTARK